MAQKAPEVLDTLKRKVREQWYQIAPKLRTATLQAVEATIPFLESLQQKLEAAAGTEPPTTTQAKILEWLRVQAIALLKLKTRLLSSLRLQLGEPGSLPPAATPVTSSPDATPAPEALPIHPPQAALPSGSSDRPLADTVREEFGIAWKFTREQVIPKVLGFIAMLAEKLDPWAEKAWTFVADKARSMPVLVETWEKVTASAAWKQASTLAATALRAVRERLQGVAMPEGMQPILAKRFGATALLLIVVLFLWLKPTPASRVAKSPQAAPTVATRYQTDAPKASPVEPTIAPNESARPVSPQDVMVADIQSQVAAATKQYGEALIQSVQANFQLGRLVVQLSDAWYQLAPGQQDRLVADLYGRAQKLKFGKLIVADNSQHLLARSPAIGSEMVVLRR